MKNYPELMDKYCCRYFENVVKQELGEIQMERFIEGRRVYEPEWSLISKVCHSLYIYLKDTNLLKKIDRAQ